MLKTNKQHTVIIPSHNTLEHLKNTVKSLLKFASNVPIIIIDDASEDGTKEWLNTLKNNKNIKTIISPIRKGHTFWYDEGMKLSKTDIVSILHSDMIIGPNYFENMLKHLDRGKVVCATRIEPPIHPAGKEKIVKDFGDEANTFNWEQFEDFCNKEKNEQCDIITKGIFAPWMLYKEDHLNIGGHDQGFAPYGYEDSDIFNRWILAGYEMIQARDSLCYHMTCRGHRWNKGVGIENADYKKTMENGRRHFLKKWGQWIKNDEYQYPIISPVYKKKIIINNLNPNFNFLNDWFDGGDDIIVEIDCNTFTQQDFQYITIINDIIKDSGEIGKFELGNLKITINNIVDYSKELIKVIN
tara:strand:+ start:7760 stop:8824 length:1065 start_codon:yes stop_codon:yes gene_type:complete